MGRRLKRHPLSALFLPVPPSAAPLHQPRTCFNDMRKQKRTVDVCNPSSCPWRTGHNLSVMQNVTLCLCVHLTVLLACARQSSRCRLLFASLLIKKRLSYPCDGQRPASMILSSRRRRSCTFCPPNQPMSILACLHHLTRHARRPQFSDFACWRVWLTGGKASHCASLPLLEIHTLKTCFPCICLHVLNGTHGALRNTSLHGRTRLDKAIIIGVWCGSSPFTSYDAHVSIVVAFGSSPWIDCW